jgi:hypothetical protein
MSGPRQREALGFLCGRKRFDPGSGGILGTEAARWTGFRCAQRPLTRAPLAFGFGGLAIGSVPSQQQLAQRLEIAP